MVIDTLKQINWVDIFVLILIFRICCIAKKGGFVLELFKILGIISALYLSFHYYANLSAFLGAGFGLINKVPLDFLAFICFIFLVFIGQIFWIILRKIFHRFLKLETHPSLNLYGGIILGIVRGIITAALVIFILVLSRVNYFNNSVRDSLSGKPLFKVAPDIYSGLWNGFMSKFMLQEKFNDTVVEILQSPKK